MKPPALWTSCVLGTLAAALVCPASGDMALALTPADIVRRADRIRAPGASFAFELAIVTAKGSEQEPNARLTASVKLPDKSLARFLFPPGDHGKILLMVGPNLWVYLPAADRPLRISPQQRLLGDVSHADVMRVNFGGDYVPTLVGEEEVEGLRCHVLELRGAIEGVTYHRIRYWVDRETFRPVKAEFYAVTGLLLKMARYTRYREVLGALRPTEIQIRDAVRADALSRMIYSNLRLESLRDETFHPAYLKFLR